jgi:restriction endonuclease Mrr
MAQLSSQIIAQWAIENLESEEWILLSDICIQGIRKQNKFSEIVIEESVERELDNVAEILRNKAAAATEHGELATYEIDYEQSPYIKKICEALPPILAAIREMDSVEFEIICAKILSDLGWNETGRIGGTQDDGVDFYGFGFPNNQLLDLPIPPSCKVLLIGQAKRYKQDNNVSETDIRKFVGGALKKLNDFRESGKVGVLTPVIFAFWITSDFDDHAKKYAKTMGIWFMNGRTLVEYLNKLNLSEIINS